MGERFYAIGAAFTISERHRRAGYTTLVVAFEDQDTTAPTVLGTATVFVNGAVALDEHLETGFWFRSRPDFVAWLKERAV